MEKESNNSLLRNIGIGTAWTTGGMFLMKSSNIIYSFLLIYQLTLYEYGVAALVLSIPTFLGILMLPSLENVVVADMGVDKGKGAYSAMRKLFDQYRQTRLFFAIIAWALLFFSSPLVEQHYNEAIGNMIRIVSFTFILSPLRSMYLIVFKVALRFKDAAFHNSIEELCKLLIVVIGLLVFDLGIVAVGLAYVGGEVCALAVMWWQYRKVRAKLFSNTKASTHVGELFTILKAHGKWSIVGTYISSIGHAIRLWAVKFFVGTDAVGLFSLAYGLFQNTAALSPLVKVIQPLIPQVVNDRSRLYTLINKGIKYQLIGYAGLACVGVFVFPHLITTLFPEYSGAIGLYQLMMLVFIPVGFTAFFEAAFYAIKAQKNLFFAMVERTLIMIVLLPIFLYFFGIYGVVLEFLVTRTYYSIGRYRMMRRFFPDYALTVRDLTSYDDIDKMIVGKLTSLWSKLRKRSA